MVNDIKYFTKIHLLTEDNVFQLKTELLQSLDELEEIAMKGKFASGKDVHIYISNINFEATYSYAASKYRHVSMIRIYAINSIIIARYGSVRQLEGVDPFAAEVFHADFPERGNAADSIL